MPTSEINAYLTPESTAKPVVHEDLIKLVRQMMIGDVMRFATADARTAIFADLGTGPPRGALSYLESLDWHEWYDGTNWVALPGTQIAESLLKADSDDVDTTAATEIMTVTASLAAGHVYAPFVRGKLSAAGGTVSSYLAAIFEDTVAGAEVAQHRYPTDGTTTSSVWPINVPGRFVATATGNKTFSIAISRTGSTAVHTVGSTAQPTRAGIRVVR